jgi:plastocyanin
MIPNASRPRRPLSRLSLTLTAALVLTAACPPLAAGTIEGRVTLTDAKSAPVMNKRYEIVAKGGTLATNPPLAVVYLEGSFPKPDSQPTAQMVQKDLMFVPSLLAVRTGTKVEFPNHDDAHHNVFSYSSPKRFDLGRYRKDERPIPFQVFDTPGLITLRCDIHEHMRALILVLDTPHFVLTDASGNFRLTNLPAGRYTLKAWLNSKKTLEQPVEIGADTVTTLNFP